MDEQNKQVQILQIQEEQEDSINIKYYLLLLFRRWWVIAIALFFMMFIARLLSFMISDRYEALATIKLPTSSSSTGLASTLGLLLPIGVASDMANEIEVINGRTMLERVIEILQYDKKEENAGLDRRLLIQKMSTKIRALKRGQTNLLDIKVTDKSPKEAQNIANTVASEYVKKSKDSFNKSWDRLLSVMEDKRTESKDELEKSRQILHEYETKEGVTPAFSSLLLGGGLAQSSQNMQNSNSDITLSIASLKSNVIQMEIKLEMLRKRLPDANPEVIELKNQLAESNQRLKEEEKKAIEKYNKIFGLSDLAAKVVFNQQMLTQLITKHEELKAQYIIQNKSAEIVENAVEPLFPVGSKRNLVYAVAFLMGIFLGVGIIMFFEILKNPIHTPENARKLLELTVLGSIPKLGIRREKSDWSPMLVYGNPNTKRRSWVKELYRESYMALRMEFLSSLKLDKNIATNGSEAKKRQGEVILITSSVPKEGKSLISANLAMSLASADMKVLLVDIDHRHSSQSRLLKLDARAGLIDLLRGKASWDDVVSHTNINNLHVVTSGNKDDQFELSGLLLSENMSNFIQTAKERFDFIIFDSTPITLGSESISSGFMIDGAILVVKLDHTRKGVALKAVQIMRNNGMNILGVVTNYARHDRKYRKYYK
jgi:capsular exopolysaccharide synthesis family protein